MILAFLIISVADLSSAAPATVVDSTVHSSVSLVPYNASSASVIGIPEPNYAPSDTTTEKWDGVVSAPTPTERTPGIIPRTLFSAALLTSGAMLTYAGIAYWQNRQAADDVSRKAGANPLGLMAVATLSIPVGAALALVGGTSLVANLVGMGGSENDPDR